MKNRLYILILLVGIFQSCSLISDYTLGDMAERRVNLPATFEKVDIKGSFSITLLPDTLGFAIVKCHQKVMHDVEVSIQNNVLFIRENVKSRWLKDYPIIDIELHLNKIPMIEIRQPCKFNIPSTFKSHEFYLVDWGNYVDCNVNVDVDLLRIDVSGESFGTYRVIGRTEYATLNAHGAALFDLSQTQVKYCIANQGSTINMDIWVTDNLKANITSAGNIRLRGNPTIELNSQGKGELIRMP